MGIISWLTHARPWLLNAAVVSLLPAWAAAMLLAHHHRREARKARFKFRASCIAGEHVCRRLAAAETTIATQMALIARLEHLNYHLSCELYGKEATDKAIQDASARGTN